jgi:hypothetical protein
MTVGRLLDPISLRDLRRKFRLGKAGVTEFPKTRRLVFEDGKPKYPLGWVVEVWKEEKRRFEELMNKRGVCITKIGRRWERRGLVFMIGIKSW